MEGLQSIHITGKDIEFSLIEDQTIDIDSIEELTERMKFNYQENKLANAEVLIAESEVLKRIEEAREEGYKEAERWKDKFMKLLDKM